MAQAVTRPRNLVPPPPPEVEQADPFEGAPCRRLYPEDADLIYFSPTHYGAAQVRCEGCPLAIRASCLAIAMTAEGKGGLDRRHGVFGGLTPRQRARLAKQEVTA